MSNSKKHRTSVEATSDTLLDQLISDKKFRTAFFKNHLAGSEKFGIELGKKTRAYLQERVRPQVSKDVARFDEKLVLCSSAPN